MTGIYVPRGRAREYAPLALNLYRGCNHNCTYGYCSAIGRRFGRWPETPMPAISGSEIDKTCRKYTNSRQSVMLCFTCDPYCEADKTYRLARIALVHMVQLYHIPVVILTKSGQRCMIDLDLFRRFGEHIMVGATLTGCDDLEPGAAPNLERLGVLRALHEAGVPTWASFEPVIRPEASLKSLREAVKCCNVVKIGKINNWHSADKFIDWNAFLEDAQDICEDANVDWYCKTDLWEAAGCPSLPPIVRNADVHQPKPW